MPAPAAPGDRVPPFALPVYPTGIRRWTPGRLTVLSFCAFWCDTWKEQNERLAAASQALRGLPADYLTISVDGRWAERGRSSMTTQVLLDAGRGLSSRLGINAVPYTLVVDPRDVVRYATQGIARAADLERVLRDILTGRDPSPSGVLYLTFDDFPAPDGNDELLDILRAQNVHATFFCIGQHIAENKAVMRRAHDEGHSLQLHSWDHQAADPQLARSARALEEATGARPTLYRPPGSAAIQRLNGAPLTLPTTNPYDYTRPGEAELTRRVLLAVKPGSVLLLHAGVAETRSALPLILTTLRKRGFSFGVLN